MKHTELDQHAAPTLNKKYILELEKEAQEAIKLPTNNEESNTQKEILDLVTKIKSYQIAKLQTYKAKMLSAGKSPNAKNAEIPDFFVDEKDSDKLLKLVEKLDKIGELSYNAKNEKKHKTFLELRDKIQKLKSSRETILEDPEDELASIDSGFSSSNEELSTISKKGSSTNLIEALDLAQARILSNSNTAEDKLTTTKELQKSIQQKEVKNEKLTQEEIDNIYKTIGIFEEIKEHEKSGNIRDPRTLNKNYYKLTDPREERRSDNIALEWDDTGMLTTVVFRKITTKYRKRSLVF